MESYINLTLERLPLIHDLRTDIMSLNSGLFNFSDGVRKHVSFEFSW